MKDLPKLSPRLFAYSFLGLVILAGLYSTYLIISVSNNPPNLAVDESNQTSSAYFNPHQDSEIKNINIMGEISKSQDSEYPYMLLSDGKKIAYLYSETNDLNLSLGLNLQIDGEVKTQKDGVDVINVKSIKLK